MSVQNVLRIYLVLAGLALGACSPGLKYNSTSTNSQASDLSDSEATAPAPSPAPVPLPALPPQPTPSPAPAPAPMPAPSPSGGPGCGLSQAAFCETFDQGPAANKGRAGDLEASKWTVGRLAPSDLSGFGPVANPVIAAPIPSCKASFQMASVFPPNDTLICDPDLRGNRQLMTAVAIQNYGNNSYMIAQPFDFTGRTGHIVFDVDAATDGGLGGYIALDLTEDPVPAPTFQEYQNFEAGPVPRNGLMLKWNELCGAGTVRMGNTLVYNNYVMNLISDPEFNATGAGCPKTKKGFLNHFEVRISQTRIEVYGTDYSPDGISMPNPRLIYAANVNLPFTRGYVHMAVRNHATIKYGFGPDVIYHWDNIGFDGPTIGGKVFDVPDNKTMGAYQGAPIMNLGYLLRDAQSGGTAGMYDPDKLIASLQIPNVVLSGSTSARLSLVAYFNTIVHTANETWGVSYRLNGGTWRHRFLSAREVQIINNLVNPAAVGSAGNVLLLIDIPMGDLKDGNNSLEFLPLNAPMDYPPILANISLFLSP
ncbi:MAG: hypothetical protein AB7F86_17120 [Bdellovibrionales bacterium]